MYDVPNAVEELKQPRKHPTAEKVEAIKDALKLPFVYIIKAKRTVAFMREKKSH